MLGCNAPQAEPVRARVRGSYLAIELELTFSVGFFYLIKGLGRLVLEFRISSRTSDRGLNSLGCNAPEVEPVRARVRVRVKKRIGLVLSVSVRIKS